MRTGRLGQSSATADPADGITIAHAVTPAINVLKIIMLNLPRLHCFCRLLPILMVNTGNQCKRLQLIGKVAMIGDSPAMAAVRGSVNAGQEQARHFETRGQGRRRERVDGFARARPGRNA
jgi:hypothetical protein